ncbi:MAG: hypothetical protein KCHDKBKB_01757 [Elusimicrobia bacterium]|nr:hypothetical protein [Elusimicrobiota bacterium]
MIKKLKITVDGKSYEVSVELPDEPKEVVRKTEETNAPPPTPTASPPAASSSAGKPAGPGEIVSPLAGRVISIGVELGHEVKEGDHVLTLEAMKMNTFVFAPKGGKIKEIKTTVGAAVQEGDILLLME